MNQVLIDAKDLDNIQGPALIEDKVTELISNGNHGIFYDDYFLAVAAAYGGLGDYTEALESVHEDEEMEAINTKLYEFIYDTLTEGDPIEEPLTDYLSEAFDDGLESMIAPMHYPLSDTQLP